MKALLTRLVRYLKQWQPAQRSAAPPATADDENGFDFASLKQSEQEAVANYFGAVIDLVQLTKLIRERHRAVDSESVLAAFEQAERAYIWAGMRTIFPPAIHCVSSYDVDRLKSKGLLHRLSATEKAVIYSPAMRRHVAKLTAKFQPRQLDSQSYNPMS